MPDRILIRKIAFGKRLVDNHHLGCRCPVGITEIAAMEKWRTEGCEIVWTDSIPAHVCGSLEIGPFPVYDRSGVIAPAAGEAIRHQRDSLNAGKHANPGKKTLVEANPIGICPRT